MATSSAVRSKSRRRLDPSNVSAGTNATATNSVVSTKWQLDFNNPVQVNALPTDFLNE